MDKTEQRQILESLVNVLSKPEIVWSKAPDLDRYTANLNDGFHVFVERRGILGRMCALLLYGRREGGVLDLIQKFDGPLVKGLYETIQRNESAVARRYQEERMQRLMAVLGKA